LQKCHASPEEVEQVVKESLQIFKKGGGYIFSQVHNIQPDVPIENILAMYKAFHEFSSY